MMWQRDTSGECSNEDEGSTTITDGSTSYDITGLEEDSRYTVSVMAMNSIGSANSNMVMRITMEAGKQLTPNYVIRYHPIRYPVCIVPAAAPTSVGTLPDTSSSITVQWGAVDCIQRNGDITGYSVRYGVQGSGSTQTMSISGGSVTEATISGLTPSTTYSIEVAAVNGAGTGVYSDQSEQLTLGMCLELTVYIVWHLLVMCSLCS